MSQPAIWQQVHALERDFSAGLLQRTPRGLIPTEDGRAMLELAATVLGSVDSLQEAFEQRRRDVPRTLVVIGSPGIVTEELARPVAGFCRRHPNIRLTLLNHTGPRTLDLLLANEADLAVLPAAADVLSHRSLLTSEPLCERPWVCAIPARHLLARKRQPRLADVVRCPLILPEQESNWRRRIDDAFRAAGLLDQVRVVLEASMTLAARRYVSLGLGVAILPQSKEAMEFRHVVVRPLVDKLLPPESIVLVWRRGARPTLQARLFADFVKEKLAVQRKK
jgi:DNA-binding transcriptional LysR family regulator